MSAWRVFGSFGPTVWILAMLALAKPGAVHAAPSALPAPWLSRDIGNVARSGTAGFANKAFTVSAAGADIFDVADAFRFVYQPLAGDGQIVARVTRLVRTNAWAKAGVMVREDTTPGSRHVALLVTPSNGLTFQRRITSGGTTAYSALPGALPAWVKLVRRGLALTAYQSSNGTVWTLVGCETIAFDRTLLVGLAVTSHAVSTLTSATFDNVSVSATAPAPPVAGPLPSPWQTTDVGSASPAGSASANGTAFVVAGSGADIYGGADAFRYVYQPFAAGGQIVARVADLENTDPWAKAGVMIREDLTPGARNVGLFFTSGNGLVLQQRSLVAGPTAYGGAGSRTARWLKLTRTGSTVTATTSADGVNWTLAGTAALEFDAAVVGLAVTSHAAGTLTTATFDQVSTAVSAPTPTSVPPTITMTSPASGTTVTVASTITLSATAADADGQVSRVDFYAGLALVGSANAPPYQTTWTNMPAGTFSLTARATDNAGLKTTSPAVSLTVTAASGSSGLVQPSSLVYQGAFRVPLPDFGVATFAYGGTALAFNPLRNSLFLVGHDWYQQVAEIGVPSVRMGAAVTDLDTAALLQPPTDATEGQLNLVDDPGNTIKIGGLLPYQNRLYISAYSYYDADGNQTRSHFVSDLDLNVRGEVTGPHQVGNSAGLVSGYFGLVPAAWQPALGGPVLNGNCCLGIITRTSFGPSVSSINPSTIGATGPAPAQPLVAYPAAHQTLGAWDGNGPYFNGTTEVRGVVFPEATRTVLFFGRQGLGPFCYGSGAECADPADSSKGTHGYPYAYFVWAYDANDLAAVRAGLKQPWDIVPYAAWPLYLPFASASAHLNGAAYDPVTGRLFVSQAFGDGSKPLIHVFTIQLF